jgi:hypothetical protein
MQPIIDCLTGHTVELGWLREKAEVHFIVLVGTDMLEFN